ncbi:hypothetical protein CAC42_1701 [Sphaceloma murrayae]|uniref:Uncharacterized protein n=1 Tax=Sphaceloma murrayae TaxID=2082308 RepID=A0A2K1QIG3_9PEZI|nr:hypothetical protein CAC42_1701 [Sphaceloma murrayae]
MDVAAAQLPPVQYISLPHKPSAPIAVRHITLSNPDLHSKTSSTPKPVLVVFLDGLATTQVSWDGVLALLLQSPIPSLSLLSYDRYGQSLSARDHSDKDAVDPRHAHDIDASVFGPPSSDNPLFPLPVFLLPALPFFPDPDAEGFDAGTLSTGGEGIEDLRATRKLMYDVFGLHVGPAEGLSRRGLRYLLPEGDTPRLQWRDRDRGTGDGKGQVENGEEEGEGPWLTVLRHGREAFAAQARAQRRGHVAGADDGVSAACVGGVEW